MRRKIRTRQLWQKCHCGKNVTVAKMSLWRKCHCGENVTVAKMSLWRKCHCGENVTARVVARNNPPEFRVRSNPPEFGVRNNPPEFRVRNNPPELPTFRSSVETHRTGPAALLRTLLRAVMVPLAKRLEVRLVVKQRHIAAMRNNMVNHIAALNSPLLTAHDAQRVRREVRETHSLPSGGLVHIHRAVLYIFTTNAPVAPLERAPRDAPSRDASYAAATQR